MTPNKAYLTAFIVFLVDQLSKFWIMEGIDLDTIGHVPLLPVLALTWVENTGVAMGMLQAGERDLWRWGLVLVTAIIAVAILLWIDRGRDKIDMFAMSLILGGAIGNIVDRIRFGYVADFIHFFVGDWSFYVFNVADAAISIGVVILLIRAFIWPDDKKTPKTAAQEN